MACRHAGHVVAGATRPKVCSFHEAHSPMAYTSWSLVRQALSMAMPRAAQRPAGIAAPARRVAECRREDHHVGLQVRAIGKHHAVAGAGAIGDLCVLRPVCTCTPRRSIWACSTRPPPSSTCTAIRRGELHHMGFQAHVAQGLWRIPAPAGRRQSPRPSGPWPRGLHGFQVFDGAVHKAVRAVAPRHLGHEGVGACGQHEFVVRHDLAILRGDGIGAPVNAGSARGQPQRKAGALEKPGSTSDSSAADLPLKNSER